MRARRREGAALLLLPSVLMLALVFVLPLVWFFVRTLFIDSAPAELPGLIADVLTSRAMLIAMVTTNWISLVVTLTVLLIGYPVAY
jgi:putative spermidine/putrescine transport system permease protein